MLLMILFGLILLIGISLFASMVGTAVLRKNARVVRFKGPGSRLSTVPEHRPSGRRAESTAGWEKSQAPGAGRREQPPGEDAGGEPREERYGERFEREYREEVGEMREAGAAREQPRGAGRPAPGTGAGGLQAPSSFAPPAARGNAGVWILVTVLAIVLFSGALFITLRGMPAGLTGPRLYFCEYVDFSRLKPINRSDTFTRGNVTLFVKSPRPLGLKDARVEVYRLGEQQETYAEKTIPLKPSWMSFSVKLLFEDTGNYRVSVLKRDGTPIGIEHLTIVPDSYAYKPIPVEEYRAE